MQLLNLINRRYLGISMLILIIGGFTFYLILNSLLDRQVTEQLYLEKDFLLNEFKINHIPDSLNFLPDIKIKKNNLFLEEAIFDTLIFNEIEKEYEANNVLRFSFKQHGEYYLITIYKPQYEKSDLKNTILLGLVGILLVQIGLLYLSANYLNKRLFSPFFNTIKVMQFYAPGKTKSLSLEATKIKEFASLNSSFNNMHERLLKEFAEVKNFTENASHELQTPLAVMQSKIEILTQSKNLNPDEIFMLDEMSISVMRLSKMNQQLLLLAKIENNQFEDQKPLNFTALILQKVLAMKEFIDHKGFVINFDSQQDVFILMNSVLADIVINNLLSNAIKYASNNTEIKINLSSTFFEIRSVGKNTPLDAQNLFSRFYITERKANSTGLGLAIVKQICDANYFKVHYSFSAAVHSFKISFERTR